MKFAPDLPPPVVGPETGLEVNAPAGVKPAKPVQERTLPPLVVLPKHEAPPEPAVKLERRRNPEEHGERRVYCRRLERRSILVELRSAIDRRLNKQRAGDITEHVDVKV